MSKIITIGREFGSGGRELGGRIADILGYAYYDREIIIEIAKRTSLSETYVKNITEHKPVIPFPLHTSRTFWAVMPDFDQVVQKEQHNIIREISQKSDCVIVGRCADYILRDEKPFRIFVYSELESKIKRCIEKGNADYENSESLSEKELKQKIAQVNRARAGYYEFYTGQKWGDKAYYDLCINTTNCDINKLAEAVAKICQ